MAILARVNEVTSNAEADTRTFLGLSEWRIDVQAKQKTCSTRSRSMLSGSAKENEPGSVICDTVLFDSACSYRNRGREEATES